MATERVDTQQTNCTVVLLIDGEKEQAANASCAIRPGRSMSFNVDLIARGLSPEQLSEVSAEIGRYLAEELAKAEALGVPVGSRAAE